MGIFKNIVFLIEKYGNLFLIGTGYTLLLSLITVFFGTILGSVLAMLKNNKFLPVKFIVTAYIEAHLYFYSCTYLSSCCRKLYRGLSRPPLCAYL